VSKEFLNKSKKTTIEETQKNALFNLFPCTNYNKTTCSVPHWLKFQNFLKVMKKKCSIELMKNQSQPWNSELKNQSESQQKIPFFRIDFNTKDELGWTNFQTR
jgi:hypothetical protein